MQQSSITKLVSVFLSLAIILFGCSDDKNTQPNPVYSFSGYYDAGVVEFCWPQIDIDSIQVDAGNYCVSADVDGDIKSVEFQINANADRVPSVCGTLRANESGNNADVNTLLKNHTDQIPAEYVLLLNDAIYAPGDTISIELHIPYAANIEIEIRRVTQRGF